MTLLPRLQRWLKSIAEPQLTPAAAAALDAHRRRLATLWLLGKTGAGKTSIVAALTGDSRAEVGNGFAPCTRAARLFEYPQDQPVMRFLDTRGLGEIDYDPREDLAQCQSSSHALLLVARVDDPDQATLTAAIGALGAAIDDLPVLLVHTALHSVPDPAARRRAIRYNARQLSAALGRTPAQVEIDVSWAGDAALHEGIDDLREALVALVPRLSDVLSRRAAGDDEQLMFLERRARVLGYAGAAGAIDLLPAVGLLAVPSVQGTMLRSLAVSYGTPWGAREVGEFLAALGTSFLYRYFLALAGRQLGKLIPVYGQSVGSAAAASMSFASTYALGRAACLYLHRRRHREAVSGAALQDAFRRAFDEQRGGGCAG